MSGFWSKLFGRAPTAPEDSAQTVEVPALEPEPLAPPEVAPEPEAVEPEPEPVAEAGPDDAPTAADVETRLGELLDSLGSAHRRPFVRNG